MAPRLPAPTRLLLGALVVVLAGCGGGEDRSSVAEETTYRAPRIGDPGPVHVHGLGINPKDGALFVATHTGLFRAAEGDDKAKRVAGRFQDTMGFTVVGPDRFLGSGHPDLREKLPPFLGLISSTDAGKDWQPVSLLGERDFHVLEAAGKRVYGFGSDFKTQEQAFLVSNDGGRSWEEQEVPEPLLSLAIAPGDRDRLVASGEGGVFVSYDAGQRWLPVDAPAGLVAWTERFVVIDPDGGVHGAEEPDRRVVPIGNIDGRPAALDSGPNGDLYVALHDGTVKRSSDGGRAWQVRSRP